MIAKSVRGNDAYGLAEYLHGAGHSEEHHWVNSRGERVSGGVVLAGDFVRAGETDGRKWARGFARLAKRKAKDRPIKNAVYHVSLSTAPGDRQLSNAEWIEAANIWLREHDAENQPFVLVRHDERHVHMAVSRIGFDLSVHRFPHDYTRNELACREIEKRFGLEQLPTREQRRGTRRNSLDRVTRAEKEMRARGVKPRKDIMREQRAASITGNSPATPVRIPSTLAPGVVAVARTYLEKSQPQTQQAWTAEKEAFFKEITGQTTPTSQEQARETISARTQPGTPEPRQDADLAKVKDEFFAELKAQYEKPAEQATVQNVLKAVQSPPQSQDDLAKALKERADRLKAERAQTQRQPHRRGRGR